MKFFDNITTFNDILLNYLDPSLKIEHVGLGELCVNDTLYCSFSISVEVVDTIDQACFIENFLKPILKSMCEFCNSKGNMQVAMLPKSKVKPGFEEYFYDDRLPIRVSIRHLDADEDKVERFIVDVMALVKFGAS